MARIEALYLHVPFCHTICPFCAFAVHGEQPRLHAPYLEGMRRELALRREACAGDTLALRSIYVGGGTPSTLAPAEVEALLAAARQAFPVEGGCEVAWEVNPEDASPPYIEALLRAGVNRISLGLQSLDDTTLAALGRNHHAAQGRAAVEALRACGVDNFNLDLMFGAPGIDGGIFLRDLEAALAYDPPHLSLYGLDIEERTRFGRDPAVRRWATENRERQAESYLRAVGLLTAAGFRHYEVSNFARPGREGRQNLIVWDGGGYLGIGPGAHSHREDARWANHRHLRAWLRDLEDGRPPEAFREALTPAQKANEALMLGLRRDVGLDLGEWERRFGFAWGDQRETVARRLVSEGRARREGPRLRLTATGFLVADGITEQLMIAC